MILAFGVSDPCGEVIDERCEDVTGMGGIT
jgi:hypothetical protein